MPTGRVVQAELGFGELYLTITQELAEPVLPESGKAGGLDIGVIHLGMVSDGEEAVAVSGPAVREAGSCASASQAPEDASSHETRVTTTQASEPSPIPHQSESRTDHPQRAPSCCESDRGVLSRIWKAELLVLGHSALCFQPRMAP